MVKPEVNIPPLYRDQVTPQKDTWQNTWLNIWIWYLKQFWKQEKFMQLNISTFTKKTIKWYALQHSKYFKQEPKKTF